LFLTILNPADYLAGFLFFIFAGLKHKTMKHLAVLIFALLFVAHTANAQLYIDNLRVLPKIQAGPTFLVISGDINSRAAKEYIALWNKYWPYAKLKVISSDDVAKHLNEESSYITLTTEFHPAYNDGRRYWGSAIYTKLRVWTCNPRPLNSMDAKYTDFWQEYFYGSDVLASYTLVIGGSIADFKGKGKEVVFPKIFIDKDNEEPAHNAPIMQCASGFMRNYIQQIVLGLGTGSNPSKNTVNKETITKLTSDTLYVPQIFLNDELPEKLFSEYPYPYKVVSLFELNKKLVENGPAFYYIHGHRPQDHMCVGVANSKTGEFIYINNALLWSQSYKRELDVLVKKIQKSNK
jgi:hypothetical protein